MAGGNKSHQNFLAWGQTSQSAPALCRDFLLWDSSNIPRLRPGVCIFFCAGQRFQLACLPANVTQGFFACLHTRVATRAGCSQVLPDSSLLDKSAGYIICEFLDLHISTLAHHQICEPWASEQWGIFKKNLKCSA